MFILYDMTRTDSILLQLVNFHGNKVAHFTLNISPNKPHSNTFCICILLQPRNQVFCSQLLRQHCVWCATKVKIFIVFSCSTYWHLYRVFLICSSHLPLIHILMTMLSRENMLHAKYHAYALRIFRNSFWCVSFPIRNVKGKVVHSNPSYVTYGLYFLCFLCCKLQQTEEDVDVKWCSGHQFCVSALSINECLGRI